MKPTQLALQILDFEKRANAFTEAFRVPGVSMLAGAGAGAGAGALGGLGYGLANRFLSRDKSIRTKSNPIASAIYGAIAGGALGTGAGAISPFVMAMKDVLDQQARNRAIQQVPLGIMDKMLGRSGAN